MSVLRLAFKMELHRLVKSRTHPPCMQDGESASRAEDRTRRIELSRRRTEMSKISGGYCWGYTLWVYLQRGLIPASPGGPRKVAGPLAWPGGPVADRHRTEAQVGRVRRPRTALG